MEGREPIMLWYSCVHILLCSGQCEKVPGRKHLGAINDILGSNALEEIKVNEETVIIISLDVSKSFPENPLASMLAGCTIKGNAIVAKRDNAPRKHKVLQELTKLGFSYRRTGKTWAVWHDDGSGTLPSVVRVYNRLKDIPINDPGRIV